MANSTTKTYLCSADPDSQDFFLKDLDDSANSSLLKRLDERASLCELSEDFWSPFCQHRFPVQDELKLEDSSLDMVRWISLELDLSPLHSSPYALQFTANKRLPWSFKDLSDAWVEQYELPLESRSNRSPEQVLSTHFQLQHDGLRIFAGVSSASDNLSPWSGGVCRIPRGAKSVCRAEQKLSEAMELLSPQCLTAGKVALDLGAAPGGWSRIITVAGFRVDAVDPGELDPNVSRLKAVTHHSTTAGDFLKRSSTVYDLIVCDMKMNADLSAGVLLNCRDRLTKDGVLILTLKLAKSDRARVQGREAVERLKEAYTIVQARQLYYNRNEITVIAKLK